MKIQEDSPGITDVPLFEAAGAACDIRDTSDKRRDVALIYCKMPCSAAGVFTCNDLKAAPVLLSQQRLKQFDAFHGVIINSGNANACTGQQGLQDAHTMADLAAQHLGVAPESLFVASTGRIGRVLPMERLQEGIAQVCQNKSSLAAQGSEAAEAILTSDTQSKTATVTFDWKGKTLTVAGMAKGAGMIEPNMATMLAFLASDVQIEHQLLQSILTQAVDHTFNRITVDGDMSTNDTVLFLANGDSGIHVVTEEIGLLTLFSRAVHSLCDLLAEKIIYDGERRTKVVELRILGAPSEDAAARVARCIGNSLLVKTSWYGNDPNWGRLAHAAGYARVGLKEDRLDITYNDTPVIQSGQPLNENEPQWRKIVSQTRFTITLNLNLGNSTYRILSTDLSEGYVDFNKSE